MAKQATSKNTNRPNRNPSRPSLRDTSRTGGMQPATFDDEDFEIDESFSDEQVGFPPYWKPSPGRKFKATVVEIQDGEEKTFDRVVFRASHRLECQKGPADNDERVMVEPGQFFSTSVYAALPIERFVGHEVILIAVRLRETGGIVEETGEKRQVWEFRLLTDDATKQLMAKSR